MNNVSLIVNNMTIKLRSDGRYEGRVTVNEKRKSFYGKTKSEVKNKAKKYLSKIEMGYIEPERIKFQDYALYWLHNYKLNKVEPSSYSRLYAIYKGQILGGIGEKYIGEITTKDVQKLIDEYANPTSKDTIPLAMSGLKRTYKFIKYCMDIAVKEERIYKNPCNDVVMPKESCIQVDTKKQFALSDEELAKIKNAALGKYKGSGEYLSRDFFVILLVVNLGLRLGEILALRWDDVDFDKRIINIKRTMQCQIYNYENEEGKSYAYDLIKDMPKTKAGIRVLPINDDVLWYLNELQEYDKRNNISTEYVCCMKNGEISHARNLRKSLKRLLRLAEIDKPVTMHTLRHTFGSVLIRRGVGVQVVSKLMGHSNVSITYGIYIHAIQEEEARAMNDIFVC